MKPETIRSEPLLLLTTWALPANCATFIYRAGYSNVLPVASRRGSRENHLPLVTVRETKLSALIPFVSVLTK